MTPRFTTTGQSISPDTRKGYSRMTDQRLPLERQAEPIDWFHPIIRALMILTTAATIIFIYRGGFS